MPKLLSGHILLWLHKNWTNFKIFFLKHKNFFEIMFLLVYGLEQIVFIYALSFLGYSSLIVAVYITILISTIGLERTLMNVRYSDFKDKTFRQTQIIMEFERELKKVTKRNKELELSFIESYKK